MTKDDSRIHTDVPRELGRDPRVHETEVGVEVDRGIVTLSGTVSSADTEIARAVRRALRWNALVPHERVRSTVSDGWVTLEGNVDTWMEREDAARVVASVPGVRGVTDEMTVRWARLWGRRKPTCAEPTPRRRASLRDVYAALMRSRARRSQIGGG